MPRNRSSAQKRLLAAAMQLFSEQGFAETTTRQIAELAGVNEVTLFRNFGSKHDLLLAAIATSDLFACTWDALAAARGDNCELAPTIQRYARDRLQTLSQFPDLLRSVVGESGHYSPENRQALGAALQATNQELAAYLNPAFEPTAAPSLLPGQLAGLLDSLIFGYLAIELITDSHGWWRDREDFIAQLTHLCWHGTLARSSETPQPTPSGPETTATAIADLSADRVRDILRQAKKQGSQDYAIAYVLFGAGLLPAEIAILQRSDYISHSEQHYLNIRQGAARQVPINQWIMGKRYGSYTHNPLTQWLKSRKDEQAALFINADGQPLTAPDLAVIWQACTAELTAPSQLAQARQTWCVEMLTKGMSVEDLSILSGWTVAQLQPYVRRAREKAALEFAIRLDRKD